MKIKRIVVMADIMRCRDGWDGIFMWLGGMMEGIISRITTIPFYQFSREEIRKLHLSLYQSYNFDLSNNNLPYQFLSVPLEAWLKVSTEEPNEAALKIIEKIFKDSLVICREPAFILKKAFNILNIPYVELAIHPVRYLDDIIMGATSNIPEIYEKLKRYEINKENFYFFADLMRCEARFQVDFKSELYSDKRIAVFFAQTPIDRSLLDHEHKKIVSFFDYKKDFENIVRTYDIVYYKSHPEYRNEEVIDYLKNFSNVVLKDNIINTYYLLSMPAVKLCAAISSGTPRYLNRSVNSLCFA